MAMKPLYWSHDDPRRKALAKRLSRARRSTGVNSGSIGRVAPLHERRAGGLVKPWTASRRGGLLPNSFRVQKERRAFRLSPF